MPRPRKQLPQQPGADAPKTDAPGALPKHIVIDEAIGWMEQGVLRQYHEGQQITHPDDIRQLVAHGAKYLELK